MMNPPNGRKNVITVACDCGNQVPVPRRDTYRDKKTGARLAMVKTVRCGKCAAKHIADQRAARLNPNDALSEQQRAEIEAAASVIRSAAG